MIHRKFLFALAACLTIALSGCGGGGGGASSSPAAESPGPSGGGPSGGGSGGGGSGGTDRAQLATWDAAIDRYNVAVRASNAATANAAAEPSQARDQAAVAALETALRAAENLVSLARNWRGGGAPDLARQQAHVRSIQGSLNEWQRHVADRYGGSGGGGNNGNNGESGRPGSGTVKTTGGIGSARHGWFAGPQSYRPAENNEFLEYVREGTNFARFGHNDERTVLHDDDAINNLFNRYVVSSSRERNLRSDGYRSWGTTNGIKLFLSTRSPTTRERFQRFDSSAFGLSGLYNWADGVYRLSYDYGPYIEFIQNTTALGQYSTFITSAHLGCRESVSLSASNGWRSNANDFCEGTLRAGAFGDSYNVVPAASGSWRGAMTGNATASGALLFGEVALTYSPRGGGTGGSVDVAITNVRQGDPGTTTNQAGYGGPSSFRWSSIPVSHVGTFGGGETFGERTHVISGGFYGPEGQEAAGIFFSNIQEGQYKSVVEGGWLAKRQ